MTCSTTLWTEIIFQNFCCISEIFVRKVSYSVSPFETLYFDEIVMNSQLNVGTQAGVFYNFENPLYKCISSIISTFDICDFAVRLQEFKVAI